MLFFGASDDILSVLKVVVRCKQDHSHLRAGSFNLPVRSFHVARMMPSLYKSLPVSRSSMIRRTSRQAEGGKLQCHAQHRKGEFERM